MIKGTAESNAAGFLRDNPQYARSAISAGAQYAQNNPELARQGLFLLY